MIEKTIKWPLVSGAPLSQWTSGRVVILGDAAHAMLPYMSQGKPTFASFQFSSQCNWNVLTRISTPGAAMAVEDGPALARSLSKITSDTQVLEALRIFEKVRIDRASKMQEASLLNGKLWHFADGPAQRARDVAMQPETREEPFSYSPNQWSDPATQMWAYAYDAEKEIDRAWGFEGVAVSTL